MKQNNMGDFGEGSIYLGQDGSTQIKESYVIETPQTVITESEKVLQTLLPPARLPNQNYVEAKVSDVEEITKEVDEFTQKKAKFLESILAALGIPVPAATVMASFALIGAINSTKYLKGHFVKVGGIAAALYLYNMQKAKAPTVGNVENLVDSSDSPLSENQAIEVVRDDSLGF